MMKENFEFILLLLLLLLLLQHNTNTPASPRGGLPWSLSGRQGGGDEEWGLVGNSSAETAIRSRRRKTDRCVCFVLPRPRLSPLCFHPRCAPFFHLYYACACTHESLSSVRTYTGPSPPCLSVPYPTGTKCMPKRPSSPIQAGQSSSLFLAKLLSLQVLPDSPLCARFVALNILVPP